MHSWRPTSRPETEPTHSSPGVQLTGGTVVWVRRSAARCYLLPALPGETSS